MAKKKTSKMALVSFGSIFFLFGFGFFYAMVLSNLIDAWQMESWHSTKAQLIDAKVVSHQSRNDDNSYTTLYKVKVHYQYQVNQNQFTGNRATISQSSTSESNDHYQILNQIKQQQSRNNAIVVWYDPSNPSNSVILRIVEWKMMLVITTFCSIFMLIGGGIIVYGFGQKKKQITAALIDPEKLWTSRHEWASPIIYSTAQGSVKITWFLFALSVLFFGTFILVLFGKNTVTTGLAILFALIPLLVLKRALRLQREWNQFKRVALHLNPYPGVIGGIVSGEIIIPIRLAMQTSYQLYLNCINHYVSGSGDNRSSKRANVCSLEQTVQAKSHLDGSKVKFNFDVPAEYPPSSAPDNNYHQWMLSVKSLDKSIPFDREYEIPVFITEASQSVSDELLAKPLNTSEKAKIAERLSLSRSGDSLFLKTPGSKVASVFAAIGGGFAIIGIGIAVYSQLFFGTAFALTGSLFLALGLWSRGRNCEAKISPEVCDVKIFWFSYLVKELQLLQNDISEIIIYKSSSSSSSSGAIKIKYGLKIKTKQGTIVDIGGELNSKKNATHMKQEIEGILNL